MSELVYLLTIRIKKIYEERKTFKKLKGYKLLLEEWESEKTNNWVILDWYDGIISGFYKTISDDWYCVRLIEWDVNKLRRRFQIHRLKNSFKQSIYKHISFPYSPIKDEVFYINQDFLINKTSGKTIMDIECDFYFRNIKVLRFSSLSEIIFFDTLERVIERTINKSKE